MKLSKKLINLVLSSCKFDPNLPGPMKIVIDVGDSEYYKKRAVELIRSTIGLDCEKSQVDLTQAIQLLILAKLGCDAT